MALVSWPAELHGGLVRGGISCVAAEVSFRGPTCIDDNSHGLLRVADGAASQQQVLFVKRVSPAASMDSVRWEEAWEWQPKDHSYTQVRNTERNKITGPNTTSIFTAEHLGQSITPIPAPLQRSQHKFPLILEQLPSSTPPPSLWNSKWYYKGGAELLMSALILLLNQGLQAR